MHRSIELTKPRNLQGVQQEIVINDSIYVFLTIDGRYGLVFKMLVLRLCLSMIIK